MMKLEEAASYALESLQKAGADAASASTADAKLDEMNIDSGEFSLMRSVFTSSLVLKALKDQRAGTIAVNNLEKETIDRAVKDCMAAAEAAEQDEAEEIAPLTENGEFASGALREDRDRLFETLREFMGTVKEECPKVRMEQLIAKHNHSEQLYLNTNGVRFREECGYYSFSSMFSAHDGDKAGSFNGAYTVADHLDTPLYDGWMTGRLLRDAEADLTARPVGEKFTGTLLISPAYLGEFLETMVGCYLSGNALIGGTSLWKDRLGERVTAPGFTLSTRPLDERIVCGERFTEEGYRSENMSIIEDGVLKNFVLGAYSARKTGKRRAGNLSSAYFLEPGEKSLEELISGIENGILINRFSGGEPAANGDFAGVAKNSFLIKNGQLAGAVTETMISGNVRTLLGNLRGISRETVSDGLTVLPWAAFDGVTVK